MQLVYHAWTVGTAGVRRCYGCCRNYCKQSQSCTRAGSTTWTSRPTTSISTATLTSRCANHSVCAGCAFSGFQVGGIQPAPNGESFASPLRFDFSCVGERLNHLLCLNRTVRLQKPYPLKHRFRPGCSLEVCPGCLTSWVESLCSWATLAMPGTKMISPILVRPDQLIYLHELV